MTHVTVLVGCVQFSLRLPGDTALPKSVSTAQVWQEVAALLFSFGLHAYFLKFYFKAESPGTALAPGLAGAQGSCTLQEPWALLESWAGGLLALRSQLREGNSNALFWWSWRGMEESVWA